MKLNFRKSILAVGFAAVLTGCIGQPGPKQYADYSDRSGFTVARGGNTTIDSAMVENLEVLAKVWGFAKYHHPVFAGESLNVDYELFELLPRVARAAKEERNAVLLEWVRGLGEFTSDEKRLRREIAKKGYTTPAEWDWLGDEALLGAELSQKLQSLQWAKRSKPSRYATRLRWSFGHTSFAAESGHGPYFSDAGYNLLSLFRLWNMAEYYFPSVNITNKRWSEVLPEYIPKFLALKSTGQAKWLTAELIAELSDSHSYMKPNPLKRGGELPVKLGFAEGKLIVVDIPKSDTVSFFEPGDEIVKIGADTPADILARVRKYRAASNENALLRDAAEAARNVSDAVLANGNMIILRNGERKEIPFSVFDSLPQSGFYKWENDRTASYKMLNDSVGYINPDNCKDADQAAIMEKFADTKAIIVDMRCYPKKFCIFYFVGDYFIPRTTHHVTWNLDVPKLPGYYQKHPVLLPLSPFPPGGYIDLWRKKIFGYKNNDYYKGRVVVLANATTQSMAEYAVMAFQAVPDCVVVGSQTAGADGNIVVLTLPYGIKTMFSSIGVYYPDGTNAQRAGVRIDHYVEPTIEGIRAGRDEVLEKALEIIEMGK